MKYFHSCVSAMVTTAVVVAISRLMLSFVMTDRKSDASSLFLGLGFLLGHYMTAGTSDEHDTVTMLTESFGSAITLILQAAAFRYRGSRTNVA